MPILGFKGCYNLKQPKSLGGQALKALLIFSLLIHTAVVYANLDCVAGDDPQLLTCDAKEPELKPNGCQQEAINTGTENLEKISEQLNGQACEDQDIWKGMTQIEREKKLKELTKLCKKEAKAYKRSVFNSLLKQGKLGQALQAIFKRKKKIIGKNGLDTTIKQDIAGLSSEEIKKLIKDEIAKINPESVKKGNKTITNHSKTIPFNISINDGKGISCAVKAKDFPSEPAYEKPECIGCEPLDIMSSFTNDCSYMVDRSSGLTEEVVLKEILQVSPKDKKQYCQPDMTKNNDKGNNDLTKINKLAQDVCKQIQAGEEPHFTVETSRNLYNDLTPQLAYKRGLFVQKYLSWHLKKNCDLQGETYEKGFDSVVDVKLPVYGSGEENFKDWNQGDYGPSPYATTDAEIKAEEYKFSQNLAREEAELKQEIADIKKQIEDLKKQINTQDKETITLKKSYDDAKRQVENMKKFDQTFVDSSQQILANIGNQTMSNYSDKHLLMKKKDILEKKLVVSNNRLASFATKTIEKKKLLQEFYAAGPNRNRSEWDEKLFNSFKMARITASSPATDDVDIDPIEKFDPEIAVMLKEMMALRTYTCNLQPIQTKKARLEGILKFPLKVATILTLPVVAVGAGAGVLALTPVNTAIGVFCRGCSEPGGKLPRFFAIGDLTQLNLSKSSRKSAWRATKGFISSYVNWGGALKVKGRREITKHDLEKYHPNWNKLDAKDQEDALEKYLQKEFPEVLDNPTLGLGPTPEAGCNSSTIITDKSSEDNKDKKNKSSTGSQQ
jgi:hypothetical protein